VKKLKIFKGGKLNKTKDMVRLKTWLYSSDGVRFGQLEKNGNHELRGVITPSH
jgi:hypothetical protein